MGLLAFPSPDIVQTSCRRQFAAEKLQVRRMVWHGGSLGTFEGKDASKAFTQANSTGAFADMHLEIREFIVGGDRVVARFTNSGTNLGPILNNPPTGKHAEWLGVGIYK